MSTPTQYENARSVIVHYVQKLGVTVDDFARNSQVDESRMKSFVNGDDNALTANEEVQIGNLILELASGEDKDQAEKMRQGFTPEQLPPTAFDVIADSNKRQQWNKALSK